MIKKEVSSKDFIHGNFIREIDPIYIQGSKRTNKRRRIILKCMHCGKEFTVDLYNALRVQQKYCSRKCSGIEARNLDVISEEHPLYTRWLSMRQRCLNPTSNNSENYYKRGIMIEPYLLNFSNYISYVSSLPNYQENLDRNLQLDRIDNSKGYFRGNLRWTDVSTQNANKRPPYNGGKYSKHCGVCYNIARKKWCARIKWKGKLIFAKEFLTEKEAYEARKQFIIANKLPHTID